jgi:hypothetical protein
MNLVDRITVIIRKNEAPIPQCKPAMTGDESIGPFKHYLMGLWANAVNDLYYTPKILRAANRRAIEKGIDPQTGEPAITTYNNL